MPPSDKLSRSIAHLRPVGPGATAGPVQLQVEPEVPYDLRSQVSDWHGGKKVRLRDGTVKNLPWVKMDLIDSYSMAVVHPIDFLDAQTSDDELCEDVWAKCREIARRDDGQSHEFILECTFADLDDERKFDTSTFERFGFECVVPKQRQEWGQQSAYLPSRYGKMLANHPNPHHANQEIQFAEVHIQGIQRLFDKMIAVQDQLLRSNETMRAREEQTAKREQDLRRLERTERWEDAKQEALVGGIKTVSARLGKIAPPAMMRLADAFADKLGGKKPERQGTDRDAFDVLVALVRQAKKVAENKLAAKLKENGVELPDGPPKLSMEQFFDLLSNEFQIDRDHPMFDKMIKVLTEVEFANVRETVEAEARGPIVVEQVTAKKEG